MKDDTILHICRDIVKAEKALNEAVDRLLQAVDLNREEVSNE